MAKKYNQTLWHSASNPGGGGDPSQTGKSSTGRKFVPSPEKIRQMARNSKEGGRATCAICKETFSMTYIVLSRIGFSSVFLCRDCHKARNPRKE